MRRINADDGVVGGNNVNHDGTGGWLLDGILKNFQVIKNELGLRK